MQRPEFPPKVRDRAGHARPSIWHAKMVAGPILAAGLIFAVGASADAQSLPSLMSPGDAVVTGFSGATDGASAEARFIDLKGPSMQILSKAGDILTVTDDGGDNPLAKFQVKAGQVGQVFGIALDDNAVGGQNAPNIYLTATSLFGIQIVTPDGDGDGQPDRVKKGDPNATFMDGQFGLQDGSGPGTIYKVDGTSGEVTVFANITLNGKTNSGPGLGNIVFDSQSRQFFVADLDTGMIHRLDLNGVPAEHFDHGNIGRAAAGLAPVAHDDTARMDITSASFDSQAPETWGLAALERRVFGLAVRDGRLYYSVNASVRQVWSVGIREDGAFADNAKLEIEVDGEGDTPMITDLAFDAQGRLFLGQRGGIRSSFDYTVFSPSGGSQVLRYAKDDETGTWQAEPQSYAIGMRPDHLEASGGVAIGNGPGSKSCNMLWSTGDQLQPESVVHGLQGNALNLVRPKNVPPVAAVFADYDGKVNADGSEGYVGDVEVLRVCKSAPTARYIPTSSPAPIPLGGGYLVPSHWKYGSDGHSKIRSHRKYGSWGHTKRRSHWKHASRVHTKRRSHWKHASRVHTKRRSHWKHASRVHTKRRSHWKHASRVHTKRRSHWKHASRVHTKRRSHWKHASRVHTKRRSHWKHASRVHTKRRSHWKHASRVHTKRRSHWKHASRVHTKRRSHWKHASRVHTKRRSHWKHASRVHSKRRSHWKKASRHHSRRISRGVNHNRRISRGATHNRRISAHRVPRRVKRFRTLRDRRLQGPQRVRPLRFNRIRSSRRGGTRR